MSWSSFIGKLRITTRLDNDGYRRYGGMSSGYGDAITTGGN